MKKRTVQEGRLCGGHWFRVFQVMEHYELHVDGEFWSSGDNRREIEDELDAFEEEIRKRG